MKFNVVLILVQFVLAMVVYGSGAQDYSGNNTTDAFTEYDMSGSGSDEESLAPIMDTMMPTVIGSMTEAATTTATTRMDVTTMMVLNVSVSDTRSQPTRPPSTNTTTVTQTTTDPTVTAPTTTEPMISTSTNSGRSNGITSAMSTSDTRSQPTRPPTTTETPTITEPTVTAPTTTEPMVSTSINSGRSNGIISAGFGIGWIIGFVIGVLLTFVVETSLFLCLRNKRRHTHPSPSGQGGEYFEMSSDMMRQRSEAPPGDNGGDTSDVRKPLIEP